VYGAIERRPSTAHEARKRKLDSLDEDAPVDESSGSNLSGDGGHYDL
jgi:hypothetical protein